MIYDSLFSTRGYLPHDRRTHTIQAVTFRLADSIPGFLERKIIRMLQTTQSSQDQRQHFIHTYRTLCMEAMDCAYGDCILAKPDVAPIVLDKIFAENHKRYEVLAWCIMPNHVHLLLYVLKDLAHSINLMKARSARIINSMFVRQSNHLWASDYFDRFIRSRCHFEVALAYLLNNPRKCNFTEEFTGKIPDLDVFIDKIQEQ